MTPTPVSAPLVVQHNALVNAQFKMNSLEMRFFIALLSRIGKDDDVLTQHKISIKELGATAKQHGLYKDVEAMLKSMLSRNLIVEELGPNQERTKFPNLLGRALMSTADYLPGEGMIRASFNVAMRPYLLELSNGFFTKANLKYLLKLKTPGAHRIYWLLREYASVHKFTRVVKVEDLRSMLGLGDKYAGRFDNFRLRVLEPARLELAATDLPFAYSINTFNRTATELVFTFGSALAVLPQEEECTCEVVPAASTMLDLTLYPTGSWKHALVAAGVAVNSLPGIQAGLTAGTYDEGYIHFAIATVLRKSEAGQVQFVPGAIFKGITKGYFLPEYFKPVNTKPGLVAPLVATPKKSTADTRRLAKLADKLDDLTRSLRFQTSEAPATYHATPAAKAAVIAVIEAEILTVKAQLR